MKRLLSNLHARLGDFWWYSLMIFCAMRAADCLNAFVGLYLVPKYVNAAELGAVMPLAQFANFLAIPAAVFASTFRQELTTLANARAFGKMKTLMRGVFIATAFFFFFAIVVSRFVLPEFLARLRIAEGSLGLVILAASFISTIAPVYTNALQTLKKFKAYSAINIISAPVRLLTMLVMMPFRAITGYFVGQAATPAFSIGASVLALRKELAVPAERYWSREIARRVSGLFLLFALSAFITGLPPLIETTTIRQCLPASESAAYYMVSRFADFSTILSTTLFFTIFPFAAEIAAKGKDTRPLILKCMGATLLFTSTLALFFAQFGFAILKMLPQGELFAPYAWAIPVVIGISALSQCGSYFTTARIAANRLGFMYWTLPLHLVYGAMLWLAARHATIDSLEMMLLWMGGFQIVRLIFTLLAMCRK